MELSYVYDPMVSLQLDLELRTLLCTCFPDKIFHHQRFKYELPQHRWILHTPSQELVAHVAVHEKRFSSKAGDIRVAGVAEVCVHPDFRGQGFKRQLMEKAHEWIQSQGFQFAALFGNFDLYTRYGYQSPGNELRRFDVDQGEWVIESVSHFLIKSFSTMILPEGVLELHGPKF